MDQYKMILLYRSILLWCYKERNCERFYDFILYNRNTLRIFHFFVYTSYLMVPRLRIFHVQ